MLWTNLNCIYGLLLMSAAITVRYVPRMPIKLMPNDRMVIAKKRTIIRLLSFWHRLLFLYFLFYTFPYFF